MQERAGPLLERHRVFHTKEVEELRAFLHHKEFRIEIAPRHARKLDARFNGVYLPGMFFGYIQYKAPTTICAGPDRDDYWVHLPVRGHLELTSGRDSVLCNSGRAGIASPTREHYCHLRSDADSAAIRVAVKKTFLMRQLAALLGHPLSGPPEFAPTLELTAGHGRTLASCLAMAVADVERADSVLLNPITITQFEQLIATVLLLGQPHNFSDALRRVEKRIAPRDVKRAIDYVHANLDLPITPTDIARAAGVPGRTLFKHFKDCRGISPMRYVRTARFDKVREVLSCAETATSVTEVASQWGFTHLGRFSVEYRQRFGESPSDTLEQRSRRAN